MKKLKDVTVAVYSHYYKVKNCPDGGTGRQLTVLGMFSLELGGKNEESDAPRVAFGANGAAYGWAKVLFRIMSIGDDKKSVGYVEFFLNAETAMLLAESILNGTAKKLVDICGTEKSGRKGLVFAGLKSQNRFMTVYFNNTGAMEIKIDNKTKSGDYSSNSVLLAGKELLELAYKIRLRVEPVYKEFTIDSVRCVSGEGAPTDAV